MEDLKEKQSFISVICVSLSLVRKQSKQCIVCWGALERAGKAGKKERDKRKTVELEKKTRDIQ